ncbi:MAG: aminopeptidase N, partial [Spirochaetaceae bacterium 4572_7]
GRNIELEIYTDKGMTNRAYHAMESLKKSMLWDEETFGLEYDLDLYMIVAVDSFNAGAMENKGLNIFNSQYVLAEPSTATDSDYDGVEGVIGHEYFHNWTGNRVTCRDWFQLTLKEGLTVFRDQEFSGDMTDRTVKRIDDVSILRGHQFPEDNGPNAHPIKPESYIEINNFYTATVYEKGAEVIRMINTLIGKKNFRKGMDLYFKLHDGNAVTTENFVDAMAEASGVDLTQFKLWYKQAGTPVVNIKSAYKDGMFTLTVDQTLPKTSFGGTQEPMFFPLTIGLYTKDGNDLTPVDNKLIISKASESFSFETGKDVIPSLLQNFSAPVIVNYDYTTNELITLLKYDRDNFNRFDSARRLTMISIDQIIKDSVVGKDGTIDSNIIDALKYLLEDNSLDNRYKATLLYIPTLDIITATMNVYDYQLADKALKTYKTLLATELKGTLFRLFEDNVTDVFELTKEAIGQRTIKNRALNILSFLGDDIKEIAQLQFNRANNMTDYMAAYSALQECEDSVRIEANSEFYGKWKDNFLVMNKWFAIQASRNDLEVLNDIKELSSKDIFDKNNPNRIRSLYGIFSGRNLAQFHREDGKGYELIANLIMDIDGFNPHVSARMATTFQTYSYLPPALAEKMKIQLEAILKIDDISSGLYEIVSKTLKTRA